LFVIFFSVLQDIDFGTIAFALRFIDRFEQLVVCLM